MSPTFPVSIALAGLVVAACSFGGAVVLGQARAGADLDAVVSFHGALISGKVDSGVQA